MASPQIEQGHTRIANELMSALTTFNFKKLELVTVLAVVRETYGYQTKVATLTPTALAVATGLDSDNVRKTLLALVAARVLVSEGGQVGLQKDYDLWQIPSRSPVKTTAETKGYRRLIQPPETVKTTAAKRLNQPPETVKTTVCTPSKYSRGADLQVPKERKKEKKERNPLTPKGEWVGEPLPFSEPLQAPPPDEEPEVRLTTPALQRPATPAPKPSRCNPVGFDDPRFTEFRETYRTLKSPRRNDGWDQALAAWKRDNLGSDKRFPIVMDLLRADLASNQWLKPGDDGTPHGFVPGPASYLNKRKWRAVELEEKLVPKANPYAQQPWGPIWTQLEMQENEMGVMNFAAKLEVDPFEARDEYRNNGFLAAVTLAWQHRRTAV
jgi:phage replication O-like protein O